MHFKNNHYKIKCLDCHSVFPDDDPFLLKCTFDHQDCLLRATYNNKTFSTDDSLPGFFRYAKWLPVKRILNDAPEPIVYKSKGIASHLGLNNLFIIFNGYWPEKNAFIDTCSFKELEAYTVCARIPENFSQTIVIASVGNTAKGFIKACSENDIPALIVIPKTSLHNVWVTAPVNSLVKIIALDSDYEDAMKVARKLSNQKGFIRVGGTKNVAKRDGLATSFLAAVETIDEMPDHYFQAVGSGAGGIGVWEMSQRILGDGSFGTKKMKLHLSQSEEVPLMVDAWEKKQSKLPPIKCDAAKRKKLCTMRAQILGNLNPVYSVKGGLYDAMKDTSGDMYKISDSEAEKCGYLFKKAEGCDVGTAAEVAIASLFEAVERKTVQKDDIIVLNITDGGPEKLRQEKKIYQCQPDLIIDSEFLKDESIDYYILHELFGKESYESQFNRYRENITAHT